MATNTIVIDGPISPYGYSKQYFRHALEGHKNDTVNLVVSSLGGSVDDALAIYDQIRQHGMLSPAFALLPARHI